MSITTTRPVLAQLDGQSFDVAIIGGGINGTTTALALSQAGYSVLLVDKADFACGATGRSGRTLHCGLQYLAPQKSAWEFAANPREFFMRLGVARQTAVDYEDICDALPDRLRPMETAVPVFSHSAFSGWQVDIGSRIIKSFSRGRGGFRYRRVKPGSESASPFVDVLRDRGELRSIVSFVDQRFHWPERIAIDNAFLAETRGAVVRNFTQVTSMRQGQGGAWEIGLNDSFEDAGTSTVRARLVLNLAGAWLDRVLGLVEPTLPSLVTGVKGVYFVTRLPDKFRGQGIGGLNRRGEAITCLPWGDLHYVGPTQTRYEGDLDHVRPDEESIRFLLEELAHFLPGLELARKDVIMAWAGVRPITSAPGHPKGKWLPYSVIHDLEPYGIANMISLTWGVLINHLSTARRLTEMVKAKLPATHRPQPEQQIGSGMPRTQSSIRIDEAAIRYCVEHEQARDLPGILFRRLGFGWEGHLTRQMAELAVDVLGDVLGWDERRVKAEIAGFEDYLADQHLTGLN